MAVSIYTTPSCGYCVRAKNYLQEKHIPFTEYNVAADLRKAEEMMRKSGQMGVPVLDVHGKIIIGFNQQELEKALKR
ncbi:MAG: NrdH-redoxin [Spirochaetales bacterium]|nr:MAG: NrdH-redoxin [Spirochaetales bacterium]